MRTSGAEPAELVAVVDLGSTAVRLLVARVIPDTGYRVLAEERVPTRLGGGAPGTLPREAIGARAPSRSRRRPYGTPRTASDCSTRSGATRASTCRS